MGIEKEILGAGLVVWGSKDIMLKLLGPTAEYLGGEVKNFAEKCNLNLDNIFKNATKRLGDRIEEPGQVPPKVLKRIIDEGAFCDDELTAEYFGGVLASSRSEIARDDRAAYFINLLAGLSTYQIRSHYVFYSIVKKLFNDTKIKAMDINERRSSMEIFIPDSTYKVAMDFNKKEQDYGSILSHVFLGLERSCLIDNYYLFGGKEYIKKEAFSSAEEGGMMFIPSLLGIDLFLWAHGNKNIATSDFFKSKTEFSVDTDISIPEKYDIVP